MKRKIEVVISDGNTIVNEIQMEEEILADVLKQHGFNWMHGTLKVNGAAISVQSEKDLIYYPISDFAPSFKQNAKIKIDCKTPDNDPSKLTAKQIAKMREKQKAAESADNQ